MTRSSKIICGKIIYVESEMNYGNEIYNNFDIACEVDSSLVPALSQGTARRKKNEE